MVDMAAFWLGKNQEWRPEPVAGRHSCFSHRLACILTAWSIVTWIIAFRQGVSDAFMAIDAGIAFLDGFFLVPVGATCQPSLNLLTIIIICVYSVGMYICICNQVTDNHIRREMCNGACTLKDLSERLGVARDCGKCGKCARKLVDEHHQFQEISQATSPVTA